MTAPESLRAPARPPRQSLWQGQAPVVAVVALGGALGATARYALALHWPAHPGQFLLGLGSPLDAGTRGAPTAVEHRMARGFPFVALGTTKRYSSTPRV